MNKLRAPSVSSLLLCLAASLAFGEDPSYFYKAKLILKTGETLTTATYGLASHFPGVPPSKPVKSVQLSSDSDYVFGHFTFGRENLPTTYKFPVGQLANRKLCVFPEYQAFKDPAREHDFFLIKNDVLIPLKNVLRVETLRVIGKGYTIIEDPTLYASIKEPFLQIQDCDTGCPGKLFSEDGSVSKEKLGELWDQQLACKHRQSETNGDITETLSKYGLQTAFDPFCVR
ncbi:MAG TPA: hypothetical protein DCM05_08560 [Elusimicrobia bacterium]|nr:hypothetical protein [Elusimicrobiota bacterium]